MKLLLLLLGYYSNHTPFYLYQIPTSSILLFKLSDISTLFNVSDIARHPTLNQVPRGECYSSNNSGDSSGQQQEYFLSAQVLSRTAVVLNRYRLAELCKLQPNDYVTRLADSILKNIITFERTEDEKSWNLVDLPLSPVISPVPSPKQHGSTESTTVSTLSNSSTTHQHCANMSSRALPVKSEPLSPSPLRFSQPKDDQRPSNPMAIGKVLWSKTAEKRSPSIRSSADDDASNNKRQRIERKVLPKPAHTVSSQQSHRSVMNAFPTGGEHGQTLLAKRQGKNSRHLTIFAPSYADPLSAAIRSAPLNSNFPHHHHQQSQKLHQYQRQKTGNTTLHHQQLQQQQQQYPYQNISTTSTYQGYQTTVRQPPKTANMLRPRHALAPLLSPGANSSHRHPEPKTTGGAIGKQEFAIPPIVPSQHQPPHTAHPHRSSGNGTHHHGFASTTTQPSSLKPTQLDLAITTTPKDSNAMMATSIPPQTSTTTYSFASLQRQQFLQPFEHLFDTIETTRTLKTTLDDQIRRSSTLLQTLQASSTTVEGLVRGYVKEMQKEMRSRLEHVLQSMVKRINQLESKLDVIDDQPNTTHPIPITPTTSSHPFNSPTAIVQSQNDVESDGYHSILNTLRERLDRLENQLDK